MIPFDSSASYWWWSKAAKSVGRPHRHVWFVFAALVLGLLFAPGRAYATLDPNQPLPSFLHQTWQTEQGLPQNSILAIAQTPNGYIWVGTEEGLVRFDGTTFTVFNARNSGLPTEFVTALYPAGGNALWVGTNGGGLARFENGRFTVYTTSNGLPINSVRCLRQDRRGVLWVGTDGGGLVRLENGRFHVYSKANGLADNTVFSLAEDSTGVMWIGTHNGFSTFDHGELVTPKQSIQQSVVSAIIAAKDGSIWLGTSDGVFVLSKGDIRHYTTANGLPGNSVSSLVQDRAGSIWIGTNPTALTRYAHGTFETLPSRSASNGVSLWSLFEDFDGDIWFGSTGSGLHVLKPSAIRTLGIADGLPSQTALTTFQDRDGELWIGSDLGLTNVRNGHSVTYGLHEGLPDSLVLSVAQDHNGTIWAGTRHGIISIDDGRVTNWGSKALVGESMVDCIFVDHAGNVWFGSRSGLTRYDGKSFTTFSTKDGLSNNFVLSLDQSKDGALWIGTQGGLNRFKDGRIEVWTTREGLANDVVHAIYIDDDRTVWIATNGGLSHLQNGKISSINTEGGLFDDTLYSILDDHDGHLWLSANRGISSISKQQFSAVTEGRLHVLSPVVYGTADGMKSRECNGGFQPASWRLKSGQLAFPTMAGLALISPHANAAAARQLSAILEHVLVDSKERGVSGTIDVPPGRGQLEFHFTAPTFSHADSIQFSYILEGFDKDWTVAENRRSAYYTNIPHGHYRFRVRAGYGDDWRDRGTTLDITLQPHIYQTLPFFVLIAMAVIGSCGAAYSWRVDQLKNREQQLLRLVNVRTAALQESERQVRRSRDELEIRVQERTIELVRSNHALEAEILVRRRTEGQLRVAKESAEQASQAKSDFLANISHELRTPINGILGMTEIALTTALDDEQREYLDIVKSSADSLSEVVAAVLDFSNIEARRFRLELTTFPVRETLGEVAKRTSCKASQKSLEFSTDIAADVPDVILGDPGRLKQVLANLLDNAVKFTKAGYVRLGVKLEHQAQASRFLHFTVEDSGIGVPLQKQKSIFEPFNQADNSSTRRYGGTGLGLTIAAQIAAMMDGRLWVESDGQHGSVFHFAIKLPELEPKQNLDSARKSPQPLEAA